MNNFYKYITPKEAHELNGHTSVKEYADRAKDNSKCEVCGMNPVWRMTGLEMCFTCTTGEADASEDYELILQ